MSNTFRGNRHDVREYTRLGAPTAGRIWVEMLSKKVLPQVALVWGAVFLLLAGRQSLIGERRGRLARPLTQSTHTLRLLAGRVDAATLS